MTDILVIRLFSVSMGRLGALTGLGGGSLLVLILAVLVVPAKHLIAASMASIRATSSGIGASIRHGIANVKTGIHTVRGAIVGAAFAGSFEHRFAASLLPAT